MNARVVEKKEDIDILVFREPAEDETSKEDFDSSQRMLMISGSNLNRDEQTRINKALVQHN
jgi:hypothetical protein